MIDSVAEDLKRLREHPPDEQLFSGTNKFIDRYNRYSSYKSNAMLASALHKFGWVFGGSVTSQKFGKLRHGKRITIQATAAGRRRKGVKKKEKLQLYLEGQLDLSLSTLQTNTPCRFVMNLRVNVFIILVLTSPKDSKMLVNGKLIPSDYPFYIAILYVYMQGTYCVSLSMKRTIARAIGGVGSSTRFKVHGS